MLGFIQSAPRSGTSRPPPSRRKKLIVAALLGGGALLAAVVTQSQKAELTIRSVPPGIVDSKAFHDTGSLVPVPAPPPVANNYRFSYWTLDGVRQADPYGMSVTGFTFKILQNSEAVAHYTRQTQDTDGDGIPDWYKLFYYGTIEVDAESDTDGDGLTLREEFRKGSNPRIKDTAADGGVIEGGISRRRGALLPVVVGAGYRLYTESSTPPGIVARRQYVKIGDKVTTASLGGEVLGHRFTQWVVNGARQENTALGGAALNQVTITIADDTTAVAEFVPTRQDSDGDGVPDWFKLYYYGALEIAADSDTDGDGRTLIEEFRAGTNPRVADSAEGGWVVEGGISRRRGAMLPLDLSGNFVRYREASQPPGVVARDGYFALGSTITTSSAPALANGFRFTEWIINGERQEAGAGFALSSASFTLQAETLALARYVPEALDSNGDGVPDWFKLYHYGTLEIAAASDTDEDGLTLLEEYRKGTQPRIADNAAAGGVIEGGIARRRGASMVINLQFFPADRKLIGLGDTVDEEFFGDPYNGIEGTFQVGAGGQSAPALADIDGDGDLDLVIGGGAGVLRVFQNHGSPLAPVFAERTGFSIPGLPDGPLYPALGDWDGDDRVDWAIGSDDGKVRLYRSNGWSAPTPAGVLEFEAGSVYAAFLPKGGGFDLLVLRPNGKVSRFAYTGDPAAPYTGPPDEDSIFSDEDLIVNGRSLSVAYVNGDGLPDILVSDRDGRIWYFRALADGGYFLNSKIWGGAYAGFVNDLRIAVADLDGNGSPDIIGGTAAGGLVHLRNPDRTLRIEPPLSTVVAGDSTTFRSVDNDGTLRWDFVRNSSGGTINQLTGEYTAGSKSGIDGIVARSDSGRTGAAWINVISPASAEGLGKAVVVAGRRGPNDPVWTATRSLARRAYEVLRYRGLKSGDITYLSHARGDVGVDGEPTREEFVQALRDSGGVPRLLLYLVDHGRVAPGGRDGLFLLGRNQQFSGTELKQWLDEYQQANPQTEVTVIIECCYADLLGEKVREGNPPRRAVYASVAGNQVAHMAASGAVSYSSMLWSDLSLGRTLMQAHEAAREAMLRFQTAVSWDPDSLGGRPLGLEDVSTAARPSVGYANPPQRLMGTSVARLWVGGVEGSFPIERVWAVVVPPDYQPSGDAPVTDLPEIELIWNATTREYEAEYGGFTEGDEDQPYTIVFHARDLWGQISPPVITTVTQTSLLNRVIIMGHGYADDEEEAWRVAQAAKTARDTARLRRVRPENMTVLGESGPPATKSALRRGILEWPVPDGKTINNLSIYLVGEGSEEGLVCANGEVLTPAELNTWLTTLQAATGCAVQVVADSDFSGRLLPALAAPHLERVVITSTGADTRNSYQTEWAGFSRWFWHAVGKGENLRASFGFASDLARLLGPVPYLLDDDGDGRYDRARDGARAEKTFIGAAFITADDPPYIGLASGPMVVSPGTPLNFWVTDVVMPDGNAPRLVWAEIVAPDGSLLEPVALLWNKVYERYDAFLGGLSMPGRHVALVYAGDPEDPRTISNPVPVQIFVGDAPLPLAPGGLAAGLELPLTGQVFDARIQSGVPFETRLVAEPGQRITLEVFGVSAGRNVSLTLLAPDGRELIKRDEWGSGFGERIWAWEPTSAGTYRVRVGTGPSSGPTDFGIRGFLLLDSLDYAGRLPQTVSFTPPAAPVWTPWGLVLRAAASSGLPVEFEVVDGPGEIVNGMLSTPEGVFAAITVRARQDGSDRYLPAHPVEQTITFNAKEGSYEDWALVHFPGVGATGIGARDQDPDGDRLTNLEEYYAGTNPLESDTDGDGLTDYDEIYLHRTDPLNSDTDGDGFTDGAEVAAGTDPNNATDYPGQPGTPPNPAEGLTNLFSFDQRNGKDPMGGLVAGDDGYLYGTTARGGIHDAGTVFRISTGGELITLVEFNGANGRSPEAALVDGGDGYFYGTTASGGLHNRGTVFRIRPDGEFATVAHFGSVDGSKPGTLVLARDGDLYGTTFGSGSDQGTIFKVTPDNQIVTLVRFNGANGTHPETLMQSRHDGFFYGTTRLGGQSNFGTVFRMDASGELTVLASFSGPDGRTPHGHLLEDDDGNLYGATIYGGAAGQGFLYKLSPGGVLEALADFRDSEGRYPVAGLVGDQEGNLYGTASEGGKSSGILFRFGVADRRLSTLAVFNSQIGTSPSGRLVRDSQGNLYGTTRTGGTQGGHGAIFRFLTSKQDTDPVNPGDPTDPGNPDNPTDPGNPSDPGNPTDPTDPGDPEEPSDPTEPTDPVNPGDPTDPGNPDNPTDPGNPSDPGNPTNPTDPSDPTDPGNPGDEAGPIAAPERPAGFFAGQFRSQDEDTATADASEVFASSGQLQVRVTTKGRVTGKIFHHGKWINIKRAEFKREQSDDHWSAVSQWRTTVEGENLTMTLRLTAVVRRDVAWLEAALIDSEDSEVGKVALYPERAESKISRWRINAALCVPDGVSGGHGFMVGRVNRAGSSVRWAVQLADGTKATAVSPVVKDDKPSNHLPLALSVRKSRAVLAGALGLHLANPASLVGPGTLTWVKPSEVGADDQEWLLELEVDGARWQKPAPRQHLLKSGISSASLRVGSSEYGLDWGGDNRVRFLSPPPKSQIKLSAATGLVTGRIGSLGRFRGLLVGQAGENVRGVGYLLRPEEPSLPVSIQP
jgi:uncharacterized repeat protein (TIGR03803 family)